MDELDAQCGDDSEMPKEQGLLYCRNQERIQPFEGRMKKKIQKLANEARVYFSRCHISPTIEEIAEYVAQELNMQVEEICSIMGWEYEAQF